MNTIRSDNQILAERYDHVSEGQFKNGLILVEKLRVKPGDAILDIGCGTGRLPLHVARITGPKREGSRKKKMHLPRYTGYLNRAGGSV